MKVFAHSARKLAADKTELIEVLTGDYFVEKSATFN